MSGRAGQNNNNSNNPKQRTEMQEHEETCSPYQLVVQEAGV